MLFVDDIVLMYEMRYRLNKKLELWRHTLESRGFKLSKLKTEYLNCEFIGVKGGDGEVSMGGAVISRVEKFKYLGSIMRATEDIDEDIDHCIRVGWQEYYVTRKSL